MNASCLQYTGCTTCTTSRPSIFVPKNVGAFLKGFTGGRQAGALIVLYPYFVRYWSNLCAFRIVRCCELLLGVGSPTLSRRITQLVNHSLSFSPPYQSNTRRVAKIPECRRRALRLELSADGLDLYGEPLVQTAPIIFSEKNSSVIAAGLQRTALANFRPEQVLRPSYSNRCRVVLKKYR